MLSSSVEYLSAHLYNSSIVVGGSRDSEWKNGVVGPKLLRKFWRTASILYVSICWTAPPNLLVKSRIDLSSRLKTVCKEPNVSLLSNIAQVLGNKRSPQLTKRVHKSSWESMEPC